MNILIVSQYCWPESFKINDLSALAVARGCNVTILTGQPNYPEGRVFRGYRAFQVASETHEDGYEIVRVPLVPRGNAKPISLILNYLSFVFFASLLGPWLLRGNKFDVVFVFGVSPIFQAVPAILLGWLKRAPVILWVQDLWPESLVATNHVSNRTVLKIIAWMVGRIYRLCDTLLVSSPAFVAPVRALAGSVPIDILMNPGDPEPNAKGAASVAPLPPGFTVLYAGNLGRAQSPETLIRAAELLALHPEILLVLHGGGTRWEWFAGEVKRRGLNNVRMGARLPPNEMAQLLRTADVLLTSLAKAPVLANTIPSRVSSYLAASRPIVASMDGAAADLISMVGAGLSSPAEDGEALAMAVLALHELSSDERDAIGRAGRSYYETNLSPNLVADRFIAHLQAAIERRRQARA